MLQCIVPSHGLCSIIFDRLCKDGRQYEVATTKHLNEYGEAGLRTLALAYKKLEDAEYAAWNNEYNKARTAIGGDREAMLEEISEAMEKDLILVGATAVEDKLQQGVSKILSCSIFQITTSETRVLIGRDTRKCINKKRDYFDISRCSCSG